MESDLSPLVKAGASPRSVASHQSVFAEGSAHAAGSIAYGSPNSAGHVFEELLDAEVAVNVSKLREASRQGVDPVYRSVVYRYLLGVSHLDKSHEMTMERELEKAFNHLLQMNERLSLPAEEDDGEHGEGKESGKRSRPPGHYLRCYENNFVPFVFPEDSPSANAARCSSRHTDNTYAAWEAAASRLRHSEPYASDPARRARMETTLKAFRVFYHGASQYDIVHLLALMRPFDEISTHAREVFFCVQNLYYLLKHYGNPLQSRRSLQAHCGRFLLLFRSTNIALYQHFFAKGITVLEWVPDMLTTLLAGRLHTDDLLRLWDCYLADVWETLSVPLHPYVVLAILAEMTEELIECEKMEILHRLRQLPRIDATSILQSAFSIRESVYSKDLLPLSSP